MAAGETNVDKIASAAVAAAMASGGSTLDAAFAAGAAAAEAVRANGGTDQEMAAAVATASRSVFVDARTTTTTTTTTTMTTTLTTMITSTVTETNTMTPTSTGTTTTSVTPHLPSLTGQLVLKLVDPKIFISDSESMNSIDRAIEKLSGADAVGGSVGVSLKCAFGCAMAPDEQDLASHSSDESASLLHDADHDSGLGKPGQTTPPPLSSADAGEEQKAVLNKGRVIASFTVWAPNKEVIGLLYKRLLEVSKEDMLDEIVMNWDKLTKLDAYANTIPGSARDATSKGAPDGPKNKAGSAPLAPGWEHPAFKEEKVFSMSLEAHKTIDLEMMTIDPPGQGRNANSQTSYVVESSVTVEHVDMSRFTDSQADDLKISIARNLAEGAGIDPSNVLAVIIGGCRAIEYDDSEFADTLMHCKVITQIHVPSGVLPTKVRRALTTPAADKIANTIVQDLAILPGVENALTGHINVTSMRARIVELSDVQLYVQHGGAGSERAPNPSAHDSPEVVNEPQEPPKDEGSEGVTRSGLPFSVAILLAVLVGLICAKACLMPARRQV
jgi:hypothetical protein